MRWRSAGAGYSVPTAMRRMSTPHVLLSFAVEIASAAEQKGRKPTQAFRSTGPLCHVITQHNLNVLIYIVNVLTFANKNFKKFQLAKVL